MSKNKPLFSIALYFCIITKITISSSLLNNYIPYTLEGGNVLFKIHPSTYIALFLIIQMIFTNNMTKSLFKAYELFNFLIIMVLISILSFIQFGSSGMAYLLDTFIAATLILLMQEYIGLRTFNWSIKFIIYFIILNSTLGILESVFKFNLIPIEKTFGFHRSTALLGHPLNNALITTVVAIGVLLLDLKVYLKSIIVLILATSLFAFGARAALAGLLFGAVFIPVFNHFLKSETIEIKLFNLLKNFFYTICAALLIAITTLTNELGDKIISRLEFDNSIQARFSALDFFYRIDLNEMLFGVSSVAFRGLIEADNSVKQIENFWIVLILRIGLIPTLIFIYSLFIMLRKILTGMEWSYWIFPITFFLICSTNNSLTTKTQAFYIFLLMLISIVKVSRKQN
jgi:hypothetical protein